MASQISISILHGAASVTAEDRERAEAAALNVLGFVDPAAASAEYRRQFEALDGEDGMTGLAALWIAATQAADRALTAGWRNPDGAACSLSA